MDIPWEILTKEQADARLEEILPRTDEYIDCAGVKRAFKIYRHRPALTVGYLLCAQETDVSEGSGYHFEVLAEACPFVGLGRLADKIKEGLSQKHIYETAKGFDMHKGTMSGRIVSDGVVVDGRHICWHDFVEILAGYDDTKFDLRVAEMSD